MFKYTTIYINIVSLLITIIVFVISNVFISNYKKVGKNTSFKVGFSVESKTSTNEIKKKDIEISNKEVAKEKNIEGLQEIENISKWYLEIPIINLKAEIKEGTSSEIMDNYIGHFEETSKDAGNIGLAAHNRGYKNNYFENLKKLKEGDEILYYHDKKIRKYIVVKHKIIKDTDWSDLEKTGENMITLITCVENEPNYRRCVQGVEVK